MQINMHNFQTTLCMNKNIIWVVLAVGAVSGVAISLIAAEALNYNNQEKLSIDDLQKISIAEGKIFADYLIPFEMSPAVVYAYGGTAQTLESYNHIKNIIEDSEDDPYMEKVNGFIIISSNFGVMTDTVVSSEEIAALVIHERKLTGEYTLPEMKPLQNLHAYLKSEYPTAAADPTLKELFGDMSVLTPQILELVETKALLGKPPHDMRDADPYYWQYVGAYGRCDIINNGTACEDYLTKAEDRVWEQPPRKDFPKGVDTTEVPRAHSQIDYHAEVYTISCDPLGNECTYFEEDGSSGGYKQSRTLVETTFRESA